MHHVEDKVELRHGADQLSFEVGRPLPLHHALSSQVTLWGQQCRTLGHVVMIRGKKKTALKFKIYARTSL